MELQRKNIFAQTKTGLLTMLLAALALGFLGSLHCIGMCGPIAFMLPLDRTNKTKQILQLFIYHFGRLMAYAIMGLVLGLIGKGLLLFSLQQKLSILIGGIMILLVLLPKKQLQKYNFAKPVYAILGKLKSSLGGQLKKRTPDAFLTIGFLNGFLPCGLVYMALLGAIALGGPFKGGLYMLFFGLGTIPLMTSAVYLGGFLKSPIKQKIRKLVPVFVVVIGLLFILRGMGLGIPYVSPKPVQNNIATAQIECHQP